MKKWYHLSKIFLGNICMLEPKIPKTSCVEIEGNIPRISVSDNILYCIRSILATKNIKPIDILLEFKKENFSIMKLIASSTVINPCCYTTLDEPFLPPDSSDFRRNNEHWFLQSTKFIYVGRIDLEQLIFQNKIIFTEEESKKIKIKKDLPAIII